MSNIKTGQPCPKMAKIEEFKTSLRQGAIKIGAPLEIAQKPYGKGGAELNIESANRNGEKIFVKIMWYGGDIEAFAKFKNLAIKDFHSNLESVLDYVKNTIFDLAIELTLGIENPEKIEEKMIKIPLNWPLGASSTERLLEELVEELKKNGVEIEIDNDQFSIKAEDQFRFRHTVWNFQDRIIETRNALLANKICKALQSQRIEAKAADNMVLLKEVPFQRNNMLQPEDVYRKARCIALGLIASLDDEEVFEVNSYRFTAEQFQEELKIWNVQSEIVDGQLWIKEKDNTVAYMAAADLDKRLQFEEEE